jgi:hypothetical protein
MSLQHAAKHLEKHGRNGDTVLVHMSKGEVKSLNDLAMAGGGHLTINPHTGLPEAGFLQRMLPVVIGAGLSAAGVPPPIAAAMVGGGYYAKTGSVKQGLMAGLGAYGGAGMGASFGEAGAASVAPEAAAAPEAVASTTPPAPTLINDASPALHFESSIAPEATAQKVLEERARQDALASMYQPPTIPPANPVTTAPAFNPNQPFAPASDAATLRAQINQAAGVNPVTPAPVTATPQPVIGDASPALHFDSPTAPVEADYSKYVREGAQNMPTGNATSSLQFKDMSPAQRFEAMKSGASFDNLGDWASNHKVQAYGMGASALMPWDEEKEERKPYRDSDPGQQYTYEANATSPTPTYDPSGREQKYFNQRYVARAADGGMMASGGISDAHYNLGGYSDGGRLLRGPGDGVSDSIPAVIGKKQPARLADGEFVVPARIVSELGNGSTEAGARKLYAMMDRIQKARGKTVGKGKVAKNSRADKYLPA